MKKLFSLGLLAVVGAVMVGLLSLQGVTSKAAADEGTTSNDGAVAKRDDDTREIESVLDDDDRDDDTDDGRDDTRDNTRDNTRGDRDDKTPDNTRDNTRDTTRGDRDDKTADNTRDNTRDNDTRD